MAERSTDPVERAQAALLAMQRKSWEQGVASHAMLDLGELGVAERMARDSVVHQSPAGKLGELDDVGIVNSGALGEVVAFFGRRDGDAMLLGALDRQLRWLQHGAPRADDGTLFHIEGSREMWIDTVYMVVPLLVLVGDLDGAQRQFEGHRTRLFDADAGLYGWRWSEDEGRMNHPRHWGTGTGWVIAGLARALRMLGPEHPLHTHWSEHVRAVVDAALPHRRADGLFHDVIDDPATFAEGNLGQMLAFTILTGVADGWLPASYRDTGVSLLETARSLVDDLGFVRPVCGAPHFDRPGTSAEAQAFFLLATAAHRRLEGARPGEPRR
ncbi:glycoside hydrolase family 88 protein [Rathayibacter sp. YIM 133350]|uniref:glycoside hydrolase family 88 protein n=1 Tax=Rathayibacter sp. YIM 133350 TaxID=3131992 RepID=UPI00307E5189